MKKHSNKNPYLVPDNYFESSIQNITELAKVANEDVQDPQLELPKRMPFAVDHDYFNQLSANVLDELQKENLAEEKLHATIGKSNPHSLPSSYFDSMNKQLMDAIHNVNEEWADTSFIDTISKEMPYQVPADYFTSFTVHTPEELTSAVEDQKTIVKSIRSRRKKVNWAAAAAILAIFSIGGYFLTQGESDDAQTTTTIAHSVKSNNYNATNVNSTEQLAMVSKEEISQYIKNNLEDFDTNLLVNASSSNDNITTKELNRSTKSMLNNVSKEDIQDFIDAGGI